MVTPTELTVLDPLFKVVSEIMLSTTIELHITCDSALNKSIIEPGGYTQSISILIDDELHDMYYLYFPECQDLDIDEDRLCELTMLLQEKLDYYKGEDNE